MTDPTQDPAEQTPTSDQKPPSESTPPSSQTPTTGQAVDERIKAMVADNDDRLWYITKFGGGKFPAEKLKTLIEIRRKFRTNPNYQLSTEQELQYREVTAAASAFLERRHPESIRLYAQVQEKKRSNPLRVWLWGIGAALVLALASSGYQTLIGNQIERMRKTHATYTELAARLTQADTDLAANLSRMCEQTLVYRAAASQLHVLLHFHSHGDDQVEQRPGVCNILGEKIPHEKTKSVAEPDEGAAQLDFLKQNERFIDKVRKVTFSRSGDREIRLEAELYDSILSLVIMPMLYALLGALTAAVRTANSDFISMTLTRVDGISLGARVLLGVVGGATIGIVFSADALEGAAGLTVLGLAFAVGYAVDLFFNLLDGVKIGLGGSARTRPQGK